MMKTPLLALLAACSAYATAQVPLHWTLVAETPWSATSVEVVIFSQTNTTRSYLNIGGYASYGLTQRINGDENPPAAPPPIWRDWLNPLTTGSDTVSRFVVLPGSDGAGAYLLEPGHTYTMYLRKSVETASQTFSHPVLGTKRRDRLWEDTISTRYTNI